MNFWYGIGVFAYRRGGYVARFGERARPKALNSGESNNKAPRFSFFATSLPFGAYGLCLKSNGKRSPHGCKS